MFANNVKVIDTVEVQHYFQQFSNLNKYKNLTNSYDIFYIFRLIFKYSRSRIYAAIINSSIIINNR